MTDETRPIRQISANFERFQARRTESLKYLTICLQSHDEHAMNLGVDPEFATLRGDPAFKQKSELWADFTLGNLNQNRAQGGNIASELRCAGVAVASAPPQLPARSAWST
jgi:hypothetical protein